jgi:hypothetical protein
VRQAREQGLSLTGPDGLLKQLTKTMIETALDQELTEHLGHEKNGQVVNEDGNVRNGTPPKTVLTESTGQVQLDVPRDRAGTFEPQIVRKRQRRLSGVDEIVLSLYAKGLTTGEISAADDRRGVRGQRNDVDSQEGEQGEVPQDVGAPAGLRSLGISERQLPAIAQAALAKDLPSPRPLSYDGLHEVLYAAWAGQPPD